MTALPAPLASCEPAAIDPLKSLWAVLLLYGVTAIGYAWLNPVFEAPDEPFHVGYASAGVNRVALSLHHPYLLIWQNSSW